MQGWIARKVSQISVLQHVNLGIELHSPEPKNAALTATNPLLIVLKKPKQPHNKSLNVNFRWKNYFDVPKF